MKPTKQKLEFFKELYSDAAEKRSVAFEKLTENREQYRTGRAGYGKNTPVVRNITYELVESEVSTDIPVPKVTPYERDSVRDRNAIAIEQLCRNVRDSLPFECFNDFDERYTYVLGGSVWLVEWDGKSRKPSVSCLSPECFIPEPYITDISRMQYCFIVTSRSEEEIYSVYGKRVKGNCGEAPKVIVCYWKNDDGEVCRYVFSGREELADDELYYARRGENGDALEYEELLRPRQSAGGIIPAVKLRYYRPKCFPIVIRKNVSRDGELFGQSDCEVIRNQQDAINRIESRIYQKLIRSAVIPYMPDDCRITPTSSVFGEVIHTDSSDPAARFGVIDTTPNINRDIEQSDRLYLHAKRLLGITDSFTGETDAKAVSGYAISLRLSQSAGRLRSKRVMKNALYAELDRIIFGLYLAFCDETLSLGFTDIYGDRHGIEFSRYDFAVYDECEGCWRYDDAYMFAADKSASGELQDTSALKELTLEFYKEGLFGNPESDTARRLCWSRLEALGYPDAHSLAAVFEKNQKGDKK